MSDDVVCPLCQHTESTVQDTFEVANLTREWIKAFGINIQQEMSDVSRFRLYRCTTCSLGFFKPESIAGSPVLYEALQKFDWYYMPRKWEHDIALLDMRGCRKGMEIGCGSGDFVGRVLEEKKIAFEGCEQNPSAVEAAHRKGLRVHLETAENLAQLYPSSYDVVCSFQVLEHVKKPSAFLEAATKLLRPGGKLLLGLPNAQSFLRHQFNLLDLPPHHMTRWTDKVLTHLQRWFPLKLVHILYEPLADYHVDGYVGSYMSLLATRGLSTLTMERIRFSIAHLIRISGMRKALRGQSIYACYLRV
jgi:SAM-dependent methyltransferase